MRPRILLIDPSDKGAMPLYTAMIAEALECAGADASILASRHYLDPGMKGPWKTLKWLPAPRWPPKLGAKPAGKLRQGIAWLFCATTVLIALFLIRPSVIHFQHGLHPRFDAGLIKLIRKFTIVAWTAHDVLPHDPSRDTARRAAAIYSAVDVVLVHSQPAAIELENLAAVKPLQIDHPVRTISEIPNRISARAKLGLSSTDRVFAAVGFIREYKGYDLLATIWDLLGPQGPKLLVLGELVDASERSIISRLEGLPNVIMSIGYASDEMLVTTIAAADAILLPHARGSDSGSLHMARAIGIPVIASDSPQLAAVVRANSAGLVIERDPALWAKALQGPLPAPPPNVPTPLEVGNAHCRAYGICNS
jgi:glycosyltransferase involved in cell wall biosynthesis